MRVAESYMKIKVSKQHYRELLHERAAILEFDAGTSKASAAVAALIDVKCHYEICPLLTAADV